MSDKICKSLESDIKDGGITLVLGSGINGELIPTWKDLLSKMCEKRNCEIPPVCKNHCDTRENAECDIFQFLRVFEQIGYKQRGGYTQAGNFKTTLKDTLYAIYKPENLDGSKTLKTIGDVLINDRCSNFPKIRRVITFNVDSLLEEYLIKHTKEEKMVAPHPITQWYQASVHTKQFVDIYHLHGFLPSNHYNPRNAAKYHQGSEGIVFGDDEYWDMTASPTSLPNLVMLNALHDSHCIFIGLSMNDPNIARWLALRANEIIKSKKTSSGSTKGLSKLLNRHYWFGSCPDELTTSWLKSRGVRTVEMSAWEDFSDTFNKIFKDHH